MIGTDRTFFTQPRGRMRSVAGIRDSWSILRGLGGGKCETGGGNQGRGTSGDTMHLPWIVGFPSILERCSGCHAQSLRFSSSCNFMSDHEIVTARIKSQFRTKLFSKLLEVKRCMTTLRHQGALELKSDFTLAQLHKYVSVSLTFECFFRPIQHLYHYVNENNDPHCLVNMK